MKTAKQIEKELSEINTKINKEFDEMTSAQIKTLRKKSNQLKDILKYARTNPREAFIISEKERISKIINSKQANFGYWLVNVANYREDIGTDKKKERKLKTEFNKENNLTTMIKQLKVLSYLAS